MFTRNKLSMVIYRLKAEDFSAEHVQLTVCSTFAG